MRAAIYLALLVAGLLAGCGQKGPLEHPQQTATAVSSANEDALNR